MNLGLVGKKCGMTRIFTDNGESIPVTVVQVEPNVVVQVKQELQAIQLTTGKRHKNRINKPEAGHFAKAQVEPGRGLWDFSVGEALSQYQVGQELTISYFSEGQLVDVTAVSRGKGFAGTVKRHNFRTQDASHGNSLSHRVPGSTGQNQTPGKVFKNKKMAGQMGNVRCTVQNQQIVSVNSERNVLFIRGTVPGAPGADVIVRPAVKAPAGDKAKQ